MKYLATVLLSTALLSSKAQQHSLVKLWESDTLAVPESVLYLKDESLLYASLINGASTEIDGNGSIAKVNSEGKILNSKWITGFNAPKGLGKFGNKLYVADISEVVVADISSAKIERKIKIPGAVFLNDLTVDQNGTVFVSDTRTGKIYKIQNNKHELWLENITNANGLKAIGTDLYILSGTKLLKVNTNKEITQVAEGFAKAADGIEPLSNGDFIVSCWSGLIYYVSKDGKSELLIDSQEQKINTADIGINQEKNIIYVPTFNKKSIIAFLLK